MKEGAGAWSRASIRQDRFWETTVFHQQYGWLTRRQLQAKYLRLIFPPPGGWGDGWDTYEGPEGAL